VATGVPASVDEVVELLGAGRYVADRGLATAIFLSLKLGRPLFLEGEAGVGKTEVAKVLAERLGRRLIRLQCYEGLDVASAVYEWNYAQQMLEIRLAEAAGVKDRGSLEKSVFSERFLIARPLLQALEPDVNGPPVLLIDELDRTDEPFEAYLLELLSDFQVTIPELGTMTATRRPMVFLTSNDTRDLSEALRRRCLYLHLDYPAQARERAILLARVPGLSEDLALQIARVVRAVRELDLKKRPSISEALDWARSLVLLGMETVDPATAGDTLHVLLKYEADIEKARRELLGLAPEPGVPSRPHVDSFRQPDGRS